VRAEDESIRGLLLTSADDDDALAAAVLAGAAGFVVKLAHGGDIVGGVRRVGAGESLLDERLRNRAAALLHARVQALQPAASDLQLRMLEMVLDGRTDPQIAAALDLEPDEAASGVRQLVERVLAATQS
jgi:two-component system response regulator DevR